MPRSGLALVVVGERLGRRAGLAGSLESGADGWHGQGPDQRVGGSNRIGYVGWIGPVEDVQFGGDQLVREGYQTVALLRLLVEDQEQLVRRVEHVAELEAVVLDHFWPDVFVVALGIGPCVFQYPCVKVQVSLGVHFRVLQYLGPKS